MIPGVASLIFWGVFCSVLDRRLGILYFFLVGLTLVTIPVLGLSVTIPLMMEGPEREVTAWFNTHLNMTAFDLALGWLESSRKFLMAFLILPAFVIDVLVLWFKFVFFNLFIFPKLMFIWWLWIVAAFTNLLFGGSSSSDSSSGSSSGGSGGIQIN